MDPTSEKTPDSIVPHVSVQSSPIVAPASVKPSPIVHPTPAYAGLSTVTVAGEVLEVPPVLTKTENPGGVTSLGIKARRVESPSSINTYKQCPRKYFYQYIMKYPTAFNIHTVLGNVVHSCLERFFDQDVRSYTDLDFSAAFQGHVQELLMQEWAAAKPRLKQLNLSQDEERHYFEEAALMLLNWVDKFAAKIRAYPGGFHQAFSALKPVAEKEYTCPPLSVRGFIDAIEQVGGNIRLMDYKTSKRFEISHEYRLQLAIYALMYSENHHVVPHTVGLYFLKDPYKFEYTMPVSEELINFARVEIELMHLNTQSSNIVDYPKNVTSLCKWSTGQCDFYDRCIKGVGQSGRCQSD